MAYTKFKLSNGEIKYSVHGVFGETSKVLEEGRPSKAMRKRIEESGGGELFRYFDTPEECDSYLQGVDDMNGWIDYTLTTTEQHEKLYGFEGAAVLQNKFNSNLKPTIELAFADVLEFEEYNAIEIQYLTIVDDRGTVDVCEEPEADFASVYVHQVSGEAVCIADCTDIRNAAKLAKLIEMLLQKKSPGFKSVFI